MQAIILGMKTLLNNHELTAYERGVIESMLEVAAKRGGLSEKQVSFYESIASNYTENALAERRAWEESFDSEKKEELRIVANYYAKQRTYFVALANKILDDENYIPPRKQFAKLCENKYARKVLNEHYREPRYGVGDMVYAASTSPVDIRNALSRGGIVLRPNAEPPVNAAKGAKQYLVLPVGEPHGILTEERWLKTRRNKVSKE